MVIWLVGLSGSGKSTIGKALYQRIKSVNPATVFIDGDEIREIFHHNDAARDYSVQGRRISAERMHALCGWLDLQGINVVCCVISMFPDVVAMNRDKFTDFYEIFIDVDINVLISRDNKNLYHSVLKGIVKNVVGMDIPYNVPSNPDMVIKNSFNLDDVVSYVDGINNMVTK
ncbi:adenylyl-sulfate kinase [Aeromonas veronii]|uniref:adenylyl-sulfate kinase n=1 Tax=Aeromonas veronii TaxID=654 RepID=UPI00226C9CDA|nr:adenylyl-sulfate kinase [Aeromonas veronii]MCX9103493.1 adenylyl-sulfate kinase [Aeromonas veronii]MCX9119144.1 adenylyl-sulfate kinase [Aeromonas veronii]